MVMIGQTNRNIVAMFIYLFIYFFWQPRGPSMLIISERVLGLFVCVMSFGFMIHFVIQLQTPGVTTRRLFFPLMA